MDDTPLVRSKKAHARSLVNPPPGHDDVDDAHALAASPQAVSKPEPEALKLPFPSNLYTLHIHAIRTANDDGTQAATITANDVAALVEQANTVYFWARIRFLYDPATDFETRHSTLLNHDFLLTGDPADHTDPDENPKNQITDEEPCRKAAEAEADKHPGRIVVFFKHGDKLVFDENAGHWVLTRRTGGESSWAARYVWMPRAMPEINLLAHEVGHYLHNWHTQVANLGTIEAAAARIKSYIESNNLPHERGLEALDGDRTFVLDTPADTAGPIFEDAGLPHCGSTDHVEIPVRFSDGQEKTYVLKPDRLNIMSYFKHCHDLGWFHLTPDQIARTHDALENLNRHDLISRKAAEMSFQISHQGDGKAGAVTDVELVRVARNRLATVARDSNGELKLIVWDINDDGTRVFRRGDARAGAVSRLAACGMGLGLVATAVRTASGRLKVIAWKVLPNGEIERKGEAETESFSELAVCRVGNQLLATAIRNASGNLQVILWAVHANGDVIRQGQSTAGAISQVAACSLGEQGLVTVVRNGSGNLQVIAWEANGDGSKLTRKGDAAAGAISALAAANIDLSLFVTPVRDSLGELKLIAWSYDEETGQLIRRDDAKAGAVSEMAACRLGTDSLVTAVRAANGNLRLIAWQLKAGGQQVLQRGSASAGAATRLSVCPVGTNMVASARRDGTGELRVSVWRVA